MNPKVTHRRTTLVALVATASIALAGCGSSGGGKSPSSTGSGSGAAAVAAAQKVLAPFINHPTPFPVTDPLPRPFPSGKTFGWLQCASPVCATFTTYFQAAASALGAKLLVVKAGPSTQELQTALTSLLEQRPDGILLAGLQPDSVAPQLKQIQSKKIPIFVSAMPGADQYGIKVQTTGLPTQQTEGKVLAAWVVSRKGTKANAVVYPTPELSFTMNIAKAFVDEMKVLCPGCQTRTVPIPLADIGSTAPGRVVSDLQAHAGANVAVFGTEEVATGLPAQLKAASISIDTIGGSPSPGNLQDVQSGRLTAALAQQMDALCWTMVDQLARQIEGAPGVDDGGDVPSVMQVLTAGDLRGQDLTGGWRGYPDYVQRFEKLWHVSGS